MSSGGDSLAKLSPAARALIESRAAARGLRTQQTQPDSARSANERVPLSYSQRRVWFFEQLTPGSATYNRAKRIELDGPLDVPALAAAVRDLFRRHEVLRSQIDVVDGVPYQRTLPLADEYLRVVDLTSAGDDARQSVERAEATEPFDLASGPFARCALLVLARDKHVLLFTASHIAFDGWSTGVLARELGDLYGARASGDTGNDAMPRQFAEFVAEESLRLSDEWVARETEYWREALAGAPAVLRLPRESRIPHATSVMQSTSMVVPGTLIAELETVSRECDATLFMTLFAAFSVLLARLSRMDDVVIGVPVAGRNDADAEGTIGFFANTLPVRVRVDATAAFRDIVKEVRSSLLGALEHRALPFDVLVERLSPERSLDHAPIVQTLFNFRNFPSAPMKLGDVHAAIENVSTGESPLELGFDLQETTEGVVCVAEYDRSRHQASSVSRWLACYRQVLSAVAEDAEIEVGRIPLLSAAERDRIIHQSSGPVSATRGATLHGLIEKQVRRAPDAIALVSEAGEVSYREMNARANVLARDLVKRGVGRDVLVGVLVERSADLVIALLAVLKAGGAYVPLDTDYPSERLAYMLGDAESRVLVTTASVAERVPPYDGATIEIGDAYWNRARNDVETSDLELPGSPDDLAYVIYTSGSTGRPKGAMVTHRNGCNFVGAITDRHGFAPNDVIFNKTPISFDASFWEIFVTLAVGARVAIARPGGHIDPEYLADATRDFGVTVTLVVPSMLQALLEVPRVQERLASLRMVACGGEVLTPALQHRFHESFDIPLYNGYGPSETAVIVTSWLCERGVDPDTVPLGRPLGNVRVYILDEHREPVPQGVVGELYIGGAAVGRGYHRRRELTAERYVSDPFGDAPDARMYRTGDLARFVADGIIEYAGRNDAQIKLRGIRIEPGEIEAALLARGDLREAVVMVRPIGTGDVGLVAYVVPVSGAQPVEREIRESVSRVLPSAMVPSSIVLMEAFPLNPAGKVDRNALLDPDASNILASEFIAPRTATESAIAAVWADLLGRDRIGVHDNFFELGGHSLIAIRMVSRVNALGVRLGVASIFLAPTVAKLAELVDAAPRTEESQPAITRVSRSAYRRSPRAAGSEG